MKLILLVIVLPHSHQIFRHFSSKSAFQDSSILQVNYTATLLINNHIDWPELDGLAAKCKPVVFPKSHIPVISNFPTIIHLGNFCCPKHPFPEGGGTNFRTTKQIRSIISIFVIHNFPLKDIVPQVVSIYPRG